MEDEFTVTPEENQLAEVRDLRVEIGGRAIVDGVSLQVTSGRITALMGASGSGKTTTGLALLGEYPPGARVSGEVRAPELVGYVPQHPATVLNPARRVDALLRDIARDQVRHLPRAERREAVRKRVLRAVEVSQLSDARHLLGLYPHQLSGGQQQCVVLAQALLLGARVIVADEPTTGQDWLSTEVIASYFKSVASTGVAVVLLSHDLRVVRDIADEVLVMRTGRIIERGPAERVWRAPRHPWTRELIQTQRELARTPDPRDSRAGSAVLRVRNLAARRPGRAAVVLRVPELELRAGECLAVYGRSGSGKTTLARCLGGLHRHYDGDILLKEPAQPATSTEPDHIRDGAAEDVGVDAAEHVGVDVGLGDRALVPLPRSLRDRDRAQLAAVQYVFQDPRAAFDERRSALDQVARTAVRLRRFTQLAAEAEALATLGSLGLTEGVVRRPAGQLSGGELQRAGLARALLARPRVLVCDEITTGLDVVTRRDLLALLGELLERRRDLAIVLITHDMDALAIADWTVELDAGAVVKQGPTSQVASSTRVGVALA